MRYRCLYCGKSVSSEMPDDSVIRAALQCPECMVTDKRDAVLRRVAKIDIDFIPKGDTFRDVVLKAREALGEE